MQEASSPLAIDLSGIKHSVQNLKSPVPRSQMIGTAAASTSSTSQNQNQQLPPEYQYRLIYYCNKCPARYAQKHNDPQTAKTDLDEHLRQHEPPNSSDDPRKYQCEYCDYRAAHETLIQAHRYVHTSQYQEKCNELYKNCKDDTVNRAPKLMHITATRKQYQQHHETIWVVDQDLNDGAPNPSHTIKLGGQNSVITSSSQSNAFEAGNSLLKKQLESKQSPITSLTSQEMVSNRISQTEEVDDSNPAASNSNPASAANSVHEQNLNKPTEPIPEDDCPVADLNERCQHCPFESSSAAEFKTHIQQHICVSQQPLSYNCEHCDYTAECEEQIEEHTRVHFNSMEKLKDVAFFTSYDKLELSMEQPINGDDNNEKVRGQEGEQTEEAGDELRVKIKKEVQSNSNSNNNNNDDDRVNENLKHANNSELGQADEEEGGNKPQKCAKIILYKNDGCLTIKKETNNNDSQMSNHTSTAASNATSQNISDRLRRRISRQGGGGSAQTTNNNNTNNLNNHSDDPQPTSHKTILVNAKTGQVISRN